MSVAKARVPVVIVSSVICLLLGVAGGILIGGLTNIRVGGEAAANPEEENAKNLGEPSAKAKGASKGGPAGAKGGGGGGAGGGGRGPSPKAQLSQLVSKLDVLTSRSLSIQLTQEEKKKTQGVLAGIEKDDQLSDDDAKSKLDALLKVVEGHKETLEAAGYRWPGQGGGGGLTAQPPNPLRAGETAKHLRSFQATLAK